MPTCHSRARLDPFAAMGVRRVLWDAIARPAWAIFISSDTLVRSLALFSSSFRLSATCLRLTAASLSRVATFLSSPRSAAARLSTGRDGPVMAL